MQALALALALALVLALMAGGCSVVTQVTVDSGADGSGQVVVAVDLDGAALAAAGGLDELRSDLDLSGLAATGWQVSTPAPTLDGGAVINATHRFASAAQLAAVMASIAGPGVFDVTVGRRRTFWSSSYDLSGRVDLTCGLSCFGDAGLRKVTGSPLGLTAPASAASGFSFVVVTHLPGRVVSSDAGGPGLAWTVPLGSSVALAAVTRATDVAHRVEVAVGAAVGGALAVIWMVVVVVRWRRRRRTRRPVPAVTPPP